MTIVMSTLPPVWLKSQVATNVNAKGPRTPPTMTDGCKPPSKKKRGTCQMVTSSARIRVATSGERLA